MGAVAKTFDRIIPNEIKPIVPVAASMFGGPLLGSAIGGTGIGALLGKYGTQALASGLTAAGTGALMGQKFDPRTVGISALFGGLGSRLGDIQGTSKLATAGKRLGQMLAPTTYDSTTGFDLTGTGEGLSALTQPLTVAATTGGTIAAMDAADKANEEYERMMAEQGMTEAADTNARRDYIQKYMNLAGFSQQEIDDALSRYGYAKGGRAGFAEGGGSLYDKAKDMNRLALEIKLIDLGYGGFGGKDLEGMSDEEIIQLYKEATSKANGGLMGTRVGYEMGGMSDLGKLFSKITGKKPTEESLMNKKAQYAKEIENQMIRELNEDYPAMETLIQIRNEANRQADMALSDYMKSLGMEPFNPPKGSMSDELINQIMEPRKEGRVEEANGGRIKKSIGGLAFAYDDYLRQADELGLSGDPMSFEEFTDTWLELQSDLGNSKKYKKGGRIKYAGGGYTPIDYYDELNYKDYLEKLEEGLVPIDETTGKPMSYEDYEQDRAEGMMAKGGRAGYAGGGSSTEQQKRENYFDLKRDEFMSLSEYLLSPMSDADLRKGKAEGGMMNLAMGGMPAEMDLRPGGFVPIGKKEKADDVPARLSKNEFVFTADAVRAAGGGSVNKGAQKMYDLMHSLEARV
jgi:hypothetical protein